jgi:hypothetical protein
MYKGETAIVLNEAEGQLERLAQKVGGAVIMIIFF